MPDKVTDAAQAAYHEASHQFGRAILAWVGRTVRESFPTAVEMVVLGDMEGSEFGFRLRGVRLLDIEGHVVLDVEGGGAPCDIDVEGCSENFVSLLEELDPQLDWLGDLDGPDTWLGEDTLDLMPLTLTRGATSNVVETPNTPVAPDEEPCDTCTPAFPGVLIGDNTSSVGPRVVSVERCDACMVYEGDLDAAWALAKVAGGQVYFWQNGPEPGELGGPDEPEWERREFAGTYRDDDCIATGTDAWIEGIDLSVITPRQEHQEYRVTWEIDEYASSPLEAARKAFAAMQRTGTTATVFEVTGDSGRTHEIDLGRDV